jgi:hypothetical protein|tara:strand:- start:4806 stop:5195 length:390 start_codon:yes stop_codon:yes gene_type:complete
MSTKLQTSIGEYHRLSLLDEAVVLYHAMGEDFIQLLDYYINSDSSSGKYFFGGPDYLFLIEVMADEEGSYWHIAYASHREKERTLHQFFDLAPFPLDRVHFCRYQKMHTDDPYKFYSWKTFKRIISYGI